jgi:tRNA-splicing ligase RtcB
VRILRTGLVRQEVEPRLSELARNLFRAIPAGVGGEGAIPRLGRDDLKRVMVEGAPWAIGRGYGRPEDLDVIEDGGTMPGADPAQVSDRAIQRGLPQLGTLGSGNHFLEVQLVEEVYLPEPAAELGLAVGTVCIAIHSGSRGFGYQVCDDYTKKMLRASEKYGIELSDRQLCCAPLASEEARRYLGAMACAANYAWVNRQVMRGIAERVLEKTFGRDTQTRLIYDVCHNIAKIEEHAGRRLCVHRKGATRAFPPGHPVLPPRIRPMGQPVFVPGDMGRASFLLVGAPGSMELTWGSTCHGAGRQYSRTEMKRRTAGKDLFAEMRERHGVLVMARGRDAVADEMPEAYKDATLVVDVMERAGISRKVVRLRPIACIKG